MQGQREEFSIRTQIIIIRKAKFYLLKDVRWCHKNRLNSFTVCGLCSYMKSAIHYTGIQYQEDRFGGYQNPSEIPIFNLDNAINYAGAIKNSHPHFDFWWDISNYQDRIKFLDWMLCELHKQLK